LTTGGWWLKFHREDFGREREIFNIFTEMRSKKREKNGGSFGKNTTIVGLHAKRGGKKKEKSPIKRRSRSMKKT